MALEPAFSEAFLHRLARGYECGRPSSWWSEHRVLGRRLRPLSLWHLLLLAAADSPVAVAGKVMQPQDLAVAVEICRLRHPHGLRAPSFPVRWLHFWKLLGKGGAAAAQAFKDYLEDFQSPPAYQIVEPEGAKPSEPRGQAPEVFRLLLSTIAITGCSREDAWGTGPGEAAWYQAAWLKQRGADVDFDTEAMRESQARLKEHNPELHARLIAGAKKFFGEDHG